MASSRALTIVMAATLSSVALSACPNLCSGHGTCRDDNWCECDKDYGAGDETFGDCSDMFCPYEVSHFTSMSCRVSLVLPRQQPCALLRLCRSVPGQLAPAIAMLVTSSHLNLSRASPRTSPHHTASLLDSRLLGWMTPTRTATTTATGSAPVKASVTAIPAR